MKGYRQKLEKRKDQRGLVGNWLDCLPFVKNEKGIFIHRPRSIAVHLLLGKRHISVQYACGQTASGSKKFTFLDDLSDADVVCHRCEEKMIEKGFPSSSEIIGHHAHIGKVKAVKMCCN